MYADCGLEFDTVYFGGGTPSKLTTDQLAGVLEALRRHLAVTPGATIFLEANPEDVTPDRTAAWRNLGIRVVSLGVQSFDDDDLRDLGRTHTASKARRAAEVLLTTGFDTISIDLMYGLEGRRAEHWRRQLDQATALGVHHLSCYQLTVHEGTIFGRRLREGGLREIDDAEQAALFFLTHEVLADAGYPGYEVSSFALAPQHRSRHNRKYWEHTPYLGLGPSAHSFVGGRRWWNHRKLRLWQRAVDSGTIPVEDDECPTSEQLALEALMLGFRTAAGVDLDAVNRRWHTDLERTNAATIEKWVESGHLIRVGRFLRPTLAGLAVADSLARSFII
jgi:oxygen-independent coproporphyrinogen-3 oxidase